METRVPYRPIELDAQNTPKVIRAFVAGPVEMYLRDVRAMLEHPLGGNLPALNFSIASMLCAVIGGLSRVFYNGLLGDQKSFKAVARRYPMKDEPAGAARDKRRFAEVLYKAYRCNLVHSLGLNMVQRQRGKPWAVQKRPTGIKIARWNTALPLSQQQLAQLDAPSGWPAGLSATFTKQGNGWRLDSDALYCGTRRLVKVLAEDPKLQPGAVKVLQRWYVPATVRPKAAVNTVSGPPITVSRTNFVTHSTANSVVDDGIRAFWGKIPDEKK